MKKNITIFTLTFLLILGFSGCVTSGIYHWGDSESITRMYLKGGEDINVQIQQLESIKQEIEASGKSFPPGFNAHLGMLYAEVGNRQTAIRYFEAEKALFPESAHYMDFTISRIRR
ncbi:MAG: DUF4810 domain-containing protein [Treponema sp.]|jgi:hypothetical protein|nr:DUF4810 domain-containing protein [Treponema sp.]